MSDSDTSNDELEGFWKDYSYGIKKFDEQSLLISSGALGISLTFIKDIVPLKQSCCIHLFYLSIVLFLATIIFGFISHIVSSNTNLKMFEMTLEIKDAEEDKKPDLIEKRYDYRNEKSKTIGGINKAITYSLIAGLMSLVLYCIINISIYRQSSNDNCKCINSHQKINQYE